MDGEALNPYGHTMTPVQDQRFRELTREYEGVAITHLGDVAVVLTCRDAAGEVTHLEVVGRDGKVLTPDEVVRALGTARKHAQAMTERVTEHLVDHLRLRAAAGDEPNLSQISRDTGVARQTLYTRLGGK